MDARIRPADRNDALHVANIIDIAGHGIDLESWALDAAGDHAVMDAARRAVSEDPDQPVHFSKAHLIEVDGIIAGGLVGGAIEKGADHALPNDTPALAPLVELETYLPGYWLVLAVAVYPEFRGRALALLLLSHAETLAKECGSKGMCLIVEDTNPAAIAIYERAGFVVAVRRPWISYCGRSGPREWLMMKRDF